jgi:hypothetical protein
MNRRNDLQSINAKFTTKKYYFQEMAFQIFVRDDYGVCLKKSRLGAVEMRLLSEHAVLNTMKESQKRHYDR